MTKPIDCREISGLACTTLESAMYTGIQMPLDSGNQMARSVARSMGASREMAEQILPRLEIVHEPAPAPALSPRWHAQQIGGGLGATADIALMTILTRGKARGPQPFFATVGRSATTGALYEGLARPAEGPQAGSDSAKDLDLGTQVRSRLQHAAVGATTFAVMGAAHDKLSMHLPALHPAGKGFLSGLAGGAVDSALTHGQMPHQDKTQKPRDLKDAAIDAYAFAFTGAALGVLHGKSEVALGKVRDKAEMQSRIDTLEADVRTDKVTGKLNRAGFDQQLALELDRASRNNTSTCVIVGDLDGFKAVNDALGHQQGDAALRKMSDAISTALRPYDSVARTGGDEFAIILPQTTLAEGKVLMQRLSETARVKMSHDSGQQYPVGISLGLACSRGGRKSAAALIQEADRQMYEDKKMRKASR